MKIIENIITKIREKVYNPQMYALAFTFSVIMSFVVAVVFVGESNFKLVNIILLFFGAITTVYSLGLIAYDGNNSRKYGLLISFVGIILLFLVSINEIFGFVGAFVGYTGVIILISGREEMKGIQKWLIITTIGIIITILVILVIIFQGDETLLPLLVGGVVSYLVGILMSVAREKVYRNKKYAVFAYSIMTYYILISVPTHESIGLLSNLRYGLLDSILAIIGIGYYAISAVLYLYLSYFERSNYESERRKCMKFLEKGDFRNALACLEKMQLYMKSVEYYNGKAICLMNLDRVDEAIEVLEEALRIYPNEPSILNNYANALLLKDDVEGAISNYKKALKIDDKYIHAWNNLGRIYMLRGKFEDAKKCFNNAKIINPNSEMANRGLRDLEELSKEALNLNI